MACLGYKGCEQGGGKPHPYILGAFVLKQVFYGREFVAVVAYIRTVTVRVTIWPIR
jgi:hypothetical protein